MRNSGKSPRHNPVHVRRRQGSMHCAMAYGTPLPATNLSSPWALSTQLLAPKQSQLSPPSPDTVGLCSVQTELSMAFFWPLFESRIDGWLTHGNFLLGSFQAEMRVPGGVLSRAGESDICRPVVGQQFACDLSTYMPLNLIYCWKYSRVTRPGIAWGQNRAKK